MNRRRQFGSPLLTLQKMREEFPIGKPILVDGPKDLFILGRLGIGLHLVFLRPVQEQLRGGAVRIDRREVGLFLQRHLDEDKFQVTALRGPPADLAEADRRLARLDTIEQQMRKTKRFLWYLCVSGTVVLSIMVLGLGNGPNPVNWGRADWIAAATVVGVLAAGFGYHIALHAAVDYFRRRDLRREREEVRRWRADRAGA